MTAAAAAACARLRATTAVCAAAVPVLSSSVWRVAAGDLRLFERFKMMLLNGTPTEATMAIDTSGRPFPLMKVVEELLRFVSSEALRELCKAVPKPVTADQARRAARATAPALRLRCQQLPWSLLPPDTSVSALAPDLPQVRWVVTVPAMWSDEAKGFMRLAALRAGCVMVRLPLSGQAHAAPPLTRAPQPDNGAKLFAPGAGHRARVRGARH